MQRLRDTKVDCENLKVSNDVLESDKIRLQKGLHESLESQRKLTEEIIQIRSDKDEVKIIIFEVVTDMCCQFGHSYLAGINALRSNQVSTLVLDINFESKLSIKTI